MKSFIYLFLFATVAQTQKGLFPQVFNNITTQDKILANQSKWYTKDTEVDIELILIKGDIKDYNDCFLAKANCSETAQLMLGKFGSFNTVSVKALLKRKHNPTDIIPEALETACAKCSPAQKYQARKYSEYLEGNANPSDHIHFNQKFDPDGIYHDSFMLVVKNASKSLPRWYINYIYEPKNPDDWYDPHTELYIDYLCATKEIVEIFHCYMQLNNCSQGAKIFFGKSLIYTHS